MPRRRRLLVGLAVTLGATALACWIALLMLWHGGTAAREAALASARAGRFAEPAVLPRVLFLGDSFMAGELSESGTGYPVLLRSPPLLDVVNAAVAGSPTSVQRRQFAAWLLESQQRPDYVFAAVGTNDSDAMEPRREWLAEAPSDAVPAGIRRIYGSHGAIH